MANPFLGETSLHSPSYATDQYGDDSGWFGGTAYHIAGMMLVALLVITAMKVAGFRAMVGIGR